MNGGTDGALIELEKNITGAIMPERICSWRVDGGWGLGVLPELLVVRVLILSRL